MKQTRYGFLKSVAGTIIVQGLSAILLFVLSISLARTLGKTGFGAYEYADTWVEVLVLFAMLGFDRLLIRQVSSYESEGKVTHIWALLRYAWRRIFAAAVFLACLMSIVMSIIFIVIQPSENSQLVLVTFYLAMFVLPLRTLMKFNQATLQGMQRVALAYLPDYVIRPILLLALVWLWIQNAPHAALAHQLAALIALSISAVLFSRFIPFSDTVPTHKTPWLRFTIPFMLISGINLVNLRGGTMIIGVVADLEMVALYSASVRVASIVALMLSATSAVAAPQIARFHNNGETQRLQEFVTLSTRGVLLLALPIALILIFFGDRVLALFGSEYISAHPALAILCLGQLVNAATGVIGWILMMTGNEKAMAKILAVTATLHLFLIGFLTPWLGLIGAATATAFTNAITNIIMVIYAHFRLQINSTIF